MLFVFCKILIYRNKETYKICAIRVCMYIYVHVCVYVCMKHMCVCVHLGIFDRRRETAHLGSSNSTKANGGPRRFFRSTKVTLPNL